MNVVYISVKPLRKAFITVVSSRPLDIFAAVPANKQSVGNLKSFDDVRTAENRDAGATYGCCFC
jgi:hypothetical protein